MSNNMKNPRNEAVQAIDFQAALQHIEEQLRDSEDSETIINRLLKGAAEFYGANRASVVEADWALNIGLLTYEWCADGVEPQKEMLQHMAVEGFPRWHDSLSLNQPIIITDVDALKDVHPDEYQFFFAVRSNIRIGGSVLQTPQSGLYRRGRPNAVSERPDLSVYHFVCYRFGTE